jgi:alkyl hydroperoxide reductase subunit AhpC
MTLQIGATAPDFEAETTEGPIHFHEWIGDSWAVLFSHPKSFTPVCTTELGYMASIKPEFDRRNVKILGLSVDSVDDNKRWSQDIEETQGTAPNYPIISDGDFKVAKLYDMLPADTSGEAASRTPADNQTVRNVFVIGPDKKIKLILVYPMTTGRNFDEVLRVVDSLQLTADHKVSTPAQWKQGDKVIIAGSVSNDQAKEIFGDYESPKPYIRIVPQPEESRRYRRAGLTPPGAASPGGGRPRPGPPRRAYRTVRTSCIATTTAAIPAASAIIAIVSRRATRPVILPPRRESWP